MFVSTSRPQNMTELVNCLAKLSPIAQYKSAKMTVESNVPAFLVVADGDRHFPADRTYPNTAPTKLHVMTIGTLQDAGTSLTSSVEENSPSAIQATNSNPPNL
jgi:hypothetical protein